MGRARQYNKITDPESIAQINPENMALIEDFAIYLQSVDRSPQTIEHYKSDLQIFFVYNLQHNGNKRFTEVTKREFVRFQNHALNVWKWSPNRIRVVKSAISSLSNYIENILDEEEGFQGFRSIIQRIESPAKEATLEKSVFTPEEMQDLLDHLTRAKEYRKAAALALAMYSGRRKAELVQFKVSHFTPENVVFDTFWKTDDTIRTKGRGVKGKQINLYVLKAKFEPYLNRWLRERQRRGITSEWLLTTERQPFRQLSSENVERLGAGVFGIFGPAVLLAQYEALFHDDAGAGRSAGKRNTRPDRLGIRGHGKAIHGHIERRKHRALFQ